MIEDLNALHYGNRALHGQSTNLSGPLGPTTPTHFIYKSKSHCQTRPPQKNPHLLQPLNQVYITHIKQLHAGVGSTLTTLRQNYRIPSGQQRIKHHIDRCVTCRKTSGPAYNAPESPALPKSRLQQTHLFDVTGLDYTGELYIRKANIESKVYVCLFTCATTRAIHLEIVEDLTVESFLIAFRHFTSHKSLPSKMISNNASTFMCADNELRELLQSQTLKETLASQGVDWQFIPKSTLVWRILGTLDRSY